MGSARANYKRSNLSLEGTGFDKLSQRENAEEKRLAVLDAWYVPGIWDVVDDIEVRS